MMLFNRVCAPEGALLFFERSKKSNQKKTAPETQPFGCPARFRQRGGSSTARPCAEDERPHPCGAPAGLILAAFQCSAASMGVKKNKNLG